MSDILKELALDSEVRNQHRVPPGFLDSDKNDNKYGDYIIWKEIISKCKESNSSAIIIITNDEKSDWVYTPRYILNKDNRKIPNNGSSEIKINVTQPFLEYEFNNHVGKDKNVHILNIEMLSHLLSSTDYNPKDNECYSNLAQAVSVESHESDTYTVISWFLKNNNEYRTAVNTVAGWDSSPSEIDQNALQDYVKENVPNINISKVDIGSVICELFI